MGEGRNGGREGGAKWMAQKGGSKVGDGEGRMKWRMVGER